MDERTSIKPSLSGDGIFVGDKLRGENGIGQIVVQIEDIAGCSATDLRRTLRQTGLGPFGYTTVLVSEVPEGYFDEEESAVGPIAFELVDDELTLDITFLVNDWDDDDAHTQFVASVLEPYLALHRLHVIDVWQDEHYAAPPWAWHARLAFSALPKAERTI